MEEMITVSIIIPVYNTADKLRRCLDSVLDQRFTDYECIMVDDGSQDGSGVIIDEYAQRDGRFKAIHKKNGGVSSARNKALEIAQGKWLVFVDSDDFLLPDHLSSMLDATADNIDMVMTGFRFLHPSETTEHIYPNSYYQTNDEISDFLIHSDFLNWQIPWDRMYRNKPDIRFDENLSLSEDRLFCYHYIINCRGIATIDKITYVHDGTDECSLSYRTYSSSMNEYRHRVFKRAIKVLCDVYAKTHQDKKRLMSYMDNTYTTLINAYRTENRVFQYYKTRILYKLGLL